MTLFTHLWSYLLYIQGHVLIKIWLNEESNSKPTLAISFFNKYILMYIYFYELEIPVSHTFCNDKNMICLLSSFLNNSNLKYTGYDDEIINGVKHEFLWSLVDAPFCSILYEAALQQWEQYIYTTVCCVSVDNTHCYLPSIHAQITPSLNTTNCSLLRKICVVQHWVAKKIT